MIKYNLICNCGKTFESWFSSSKEFDKLKLKTEKPRIITGGTARRGLLVY